MWLAFFQSIKGGLLSQGQGIGGEVVNGQFQDKIQALGDMVHGLTGQTGHEIKGQVGKSCLPGGLDRINGSLGRVAAAQPSQKRIDACLKAQAEPVDPCLPPDMKGFQLVRTIHTLGIGLQSDLTV